MEVVTHYLTKGATFPFTIAGINCNALIHTGTTRGCISETFCNQLMLPWMLKGFHLVVTSASGRTLYPIGIVQFLFKLGGYSSEFYFIVHQNQTRPITLGLDFMQKH